MSGYVANWGNDNNDGLTRDTAKKSIQGAMDGSLTSPYYLFGLFNETIVPTPDYVFYGNNEAVISGSLLAVVVNSSANLTDILLDGLKVVNFNKLHNLGITTTLNIINSHIHNGALIAESNTSPVYINGSVLSKVLAITIQTNVNNNGIRSACIKSSTIHNIGIFNLTVAGAGSTYDALALGNSIYSNMTLNLLALTSIAIPVFIYNLFINVSFKFSGGGLGFDETVSSYPTGATDADKIQNLRNRMATVYGGLASDYLIGCKYYSGSYNDIFVDADNGDFNLVPYCIAAHMSYEGDYIGARREGLKANWNADWANIVNIDANGRVIDQTLEASAESNIIDVTHVRSIVRFNSLGLRAARNGQQINTESNLSAQIDAGTNVLIAGKTYQVVNNVITLDNPAMTSYTPFECFVAINAGGGAGVNGLGFAAGGGAVKEVFTGAAVYDSKIQIKCSKIDPTLAAATLITCFQNVYPILVIVDGSGEPTLGNADVGYDELTAVPLYIRYIKFFIKIKAGQLAAR